jgi:hypothetical protein
LSGAIVAAVVLTLLSMRELMVASGGPVALARAERIWQLTRWLLLVFTLLMLDRFVGILQPGSIK